MDKTDDNATQRAIPDTRRAWVAPAYSRVRAGDAEIGPNPVVSDGGFTSS